MKIGFIVFALFTAIAIQGCGSSNHDPIYSDQYIFPNDSSSNAERAYNSAVVTADNNASSSVAMLVSKQLNYGIGICSAFPISPTHMMTNYHCLPADLKQEGADCRGKIKFLWPRTSGLNEETRECNRIAKLAPYNQFIAQRFSIPNDPLSFADFAMIELTAPTSRNSLLLNYDGIQAEEQYFAHTMNPTVNTQLPPSERIISGYITKKTCVAKNQTFLIPLSNSSTSEIRILGDCEIIHGNSGSPLLNASLQVVGIIFGTLPDTIRNNIHQGFIQSGISVDAISNLSMTFNFSALGREHPLLPTVRSESIPSLTRLATTDVSTNDWLDSNSSQQLEQYLTQKLADLNSSHGTQFQWTYQTLAVDNSQLIVPTPECIRQDLDWLNSYERGLFRRRHTQNAQFDFIIPAFSLKAHINRYLQLRIQNQEFATNSAILHVNPEEIYSSHQTSASFTVDFSQLPYATSPRECSFARSSCIIANRNLQMCPSEAAALTDQAHSQ